jgi:4-amino-4-deoxy-L-arabinose transferase-like glycosyltransferase
MKIKKKDINKILTIFLFTHLIVWTLIPAISNHNLPLDTIEALAWGSNLDWGFNKHPPLSAFFLEIFYQIFGNLDWAYYFLSQLFVISTFLIVFRFSENFFNNSNYSLISVFLLEGIYFYNFTTPEFNVNVCQLPFWALSTLYCWKGFQYNRTLDWLLFGLFAALGILSKYLFIYLLAAIDVVFLYLIFRKKISYKSFISLISFFLVLLPHLIWLVQNDYITINYALHRTGTGEKFIFDHLYHPSIFLLKQIGILIPFFTMLFILIVKFKIKFNFKDNKLIFLFIINIIPIFLMFLTSLVMGVKIRTMWMTPFYLFFGTFFVYIFQSKINVDKLKNFFITFLILFILSPTIYLYISVSQKNKRTDYPGKKIAIQVQESWDQKFNSNISYVSGDEWVAGNLSYHLKSRPKWIGQNKDMKSKYKLSIVDVFKNNISEAVSKIGYFKVYGD